MVRVLIISTIIILSSLHSYSQGIKRIIFVPGIQLMDFRNDATNVHNLGYGLDMTISIPNKDFLRLEGASHGFMILFNTWMSGGIEFIKAQPVKLYAEAGISYLVNIGVGYTSLQIFDFKDKYWHLFTGLPIPIPLGSELTQSMLFEPYIRCKLNTGLPVSELGILVKYPLFAGSESL